MKAEDLMLNNYVLFDGKIAEVIAIKIHPREDLVTIKYDYHDGKAFHCPTVEISRIEPIPLNESELERLGVDVKGFDKRKFCRTLSKDGVKFRISNSGHIYHGKRFIPDVHTAQNLFKSLTGKQLVYVK